MPFVPFALERWQSTWEHRVRINLSESGVHPLSVGELLALAGEPLATVTDRRLGYGHSDGTPALRRAIADLYPGADPDDVTVTTGSAEANFITCWALLEPGDPVAILAPAYMQIWGLGDNFGAKVTPFRLRPERGWEPDPDEITRAITPATKLVVVTDPNNPTGHVLSREARELIVERTRAARAWLLVDEVYRGAELGGVTTPTWWGSYERTLIVNGLSKAYGLPGLRIGWIVAPPGMKRTFFERHDYTVIGPSPLSDHLAIRALAVRERIFHRTRGILNANYPVLEQWLASFDGLFDWRKPDCGAICFVRYRSALPALELVERVRAELGILLVPGEHFAMPGHLRLGYGNPSDELTTALGELRPWFAALRRSP
jgi:aspartate/methionine/tyrosine aminotransferase